MWSLANSMHAVRRETTYMWQLQEVWPEMPRVSRRVRPSLPRREQGHGKEGEENIRPDNVQKQHYRLKFTHFSTSVRNFPAALSCPT